MKRLFTFFAVLLLGVGLTKETDAQVSYEVRLTRAFRVSGSLDVDVEIMSTGSASFVLSTSTFVFTYNTGALGSPSRISSLNGPWTGTNDPDYNAVTLNSGSGYAGLTVEFAGGDDDNGPTVPSSFTRIGTVRFTILDMAQSDVLSWKDIGTNTQVFRLADPGNPLDQQTDITPDGTFDDPGSQPLPIQLASSAANVVRGNDVEVGWKTVSETNNYGFEVDRKRGENSEWTKVGFVQGHGTTLAPQSYSYVDRSLSFGEYFYRIKQIDLDGTSETFPEMAVTVGIGPDKFVLSQNYPNPFNPSTVIEFVVPVSGHTTLRVYNVLGQQVATLFEGNAEAGKINAARFDATSLPSGLYFYTLRNAAKTETKRMLLVK
jgi:hypothetical protein